VTAQRDAGAIHDTGIDGAAIKPAECDVSSAADLPFRRVVVDFEGHEHLPDAEVLSDLADSVDELRVTVPVRADGFDPLGDDSAFDALPGGTKRVLVAGNPAYLADDERRRAVAPRLGAAVDRTNDPWVGAEGVERVALATGATQFALLSPGTAREFRALRAAGFEGELAVYAPVVLSDDRDAVLDALGDYVARRAPVRDALPAGGRTDGGADGRAREVLLDACRDYALVGSAEEVGGRVEALHEAGADHVVGYPARGLGAFGVRG